MTTKTEKATPTRDLICKVCDRGPCAYSKTNAGTTINRSSCLVEKKER
jgi:hypothetical protein